MRKNIVFIHLESVSQMAFWQYSAEIPTLFRLMQRSASFSNFFASSTSSVMSFGDLLFGDSSKLDHFETFPKDRSGLAPGEPNLFAALFDEGYRVRGVQYGSFCVGDAPNNFWGIWPERCGQFDWQNDYGRLCEANAAFLHQSKREGAPFALYFWNMNTHLRDADPRKAANLSYDERFREGYRLLDASVKDLLDTLMELELLGETIVVVLGDHGDDLWRHGVYRGRSHIIDPYADVCWCPFFIHNNDVGILASPQLVSMVDVAPTLLHMLGLPPMRKTSIFSGINIFKETRFLAFSQSMFALQKERSDRIRALTKSYAVTNGDFRVMVSSPADVDDTGGVEFFLEQWDFGDTRNLLDFCRLGPNGELVGFGAADGVHPHFCFTFNQRQTQNMAAQYAVLLRNLHGFVRQKETLALQNFKGGHAHTFPEEHFLKARRRPKIS